MRAEGTHITATRYNTYNTISYVYCNVMSTPIRAVTPIRHKMSAA